MTEEALFDAAVKLAEVERAAFLDRECAGQPEVRQRLDALLAADDRTGGWAKANPSLVPSVLKPGSVFAGRYKLREMLGEGGMGVVYVADQTEPVQRRVALKIIRANLPTDKLLARFEQERQALALMDYPNIAKVYDAGVAENTPYFVMELIKGLPITKYCDDAKLTPSQRLELFVPVCQAVQHAHQKGIIHRDLKPANIIVGLYDGRPVPKVIDFGVAKATGPRISEHSVYTEAGSIIGTLEYMSPEQAELNNLDIDTRTDVYALGVILYELLTGTVPHSRKELEKAGLGEMLRVIKEVEPPKPSTKLSHSGSLPSIAAQRHTEPAKLSKLMRGDLDWITMKALEKDRSRRYETANGLAMDVQRYLAGEMVQAAPPSPGYRLRKFASKNRAALSTAAALAVLLVAGISVSTWQAWRAREAERAAQVSAESEAEQRRRAEANERQAIEAAAAEKTARQAAQKNAEIAEAVSDFLQTGLLAQAHGNHQANMLLASGRPVTEAELDPRISVLLDRAAAELTPEKAAVQFKDHPHVLAEILQTIGNTYRGIGKYEPAISHLKRARELRKATLGPDDPVALATSSRLASAYLEFDNLPEAIRIFEYVRAAQVRTLGADHPDTLDTVHNLAAACIRSGKSLDAIPLLEQVCETHVRRDGAGNQITLATQCTLGWAYFSSGKLQEATQLWERVRRAQINNLGADHPDTLATLNNLSIAYSGLGKLPEALRIAEQVRDVYATKSGPEHPFTLVAMKNVASLYERTGKLTEAIRIYEHVHARESAVLPPDHQHTLVTLNHLGRAYAADGRFEEGIRTLERARGAQSAKLGPEHQDTLTTTHNLAMAYKNAGKLPEAIQILEPLIAIKLRKDGLEHHDTQGTMSLLANTYQAAGRLLEAALLYEQVRDVRVAKRGLDHPLTLLTLSSLGSVYDELGRQPEAIRLVEQAVRGIEKRKFQDEQARRILLNTFVCYERAMAYTAAEVWRRKWLAAVREKSGAESAAYAGELAGLGGNLIKQSKFAEAESILRECLAIQENAEPDAWTTFDTKSLLGICAAEQKKFAEAEALLLAGYEGLRQRETTIPAAMRPVRLVESLERLVKLYDAWEKPEDAAKWRAKLEAQKK